MKEEIGVLVVGATFAGIGVAASLSGTGTNVRLIERTMLVGHEFINSYRPGMNWNRKTESFQAEELRGLWMQRNVLAEDGRVHIGGMAPTLHERLLEWKLPILLQTEIVEVKALEDGGYEATLFDASGIREVRAERIVDTTSECLTSPGREAASAKFIGANLHYLGTEGAVQPVMPEVLGERMTPGRFASEAYLQLPIETNATWDEARHELHRYWASRPEELAPWTIAAVADVFAVHPAAHASRLGDGWSWLPSCAGDNPLLALEAGYQFGEKELRT